MRYHPFVCCVLFCSVLFAFLFVPVSLATSDRLSSTDPATHGVIVKWKSTAHPQRQMLNRRLQQKRVRVEAEARALHLSLVDSPTLSTDALIAELEKLPDVEYAIPNIPFQIHAEEIPWGVNTPNGTKAITAHAQGYTGDGVVVAVLDTGVKLDHEDLQSNIWQAPNGGDCLIDSVAVDNGCPNGGYDFVNSDTNPTDDQGHGTHVAGTIAAVDNTVGVIGVAPLAEIMAVKVMNSAGSGTFYDIMRGIQFAIDNGADVINMSIGAAHDGPSYGALQDALTNAEAAGVVVVASAGNASTNTPSIPAHIGNVLSVAAVQEVTDAGADDSAYATHLASFSNWGSVDIAAPGVSVLSTTVNGSYGSLSGTSMAAPHVAGVAALIKGANPSLTAAHIRFIIQTTAEDVGDPGKDEFLGSGLIDASAAVQVATNTTTSTVLLEANWKENTSVSYASGYYLEPTIYSAMQPADGETITTLRVKAASANGTPLSGASITLTTTAGTIVGDATKTTDVTGYARFLLQSPTTAGGATVTATVADGATDSITMRFADTLLVVDTGQPGNGGDEGWYYSQALEYLNVNWKMSVHPFPSWETELDSYTSVVWLTGPMSLNSSEQAHIKTYLDNGGHLFLSGGDMLFTQRYYAQTSTASTAKTLLQDDTIYNDYLKVGYGNAVAQTHTLMGDGVFEGTGADITDWSILSINYTITDEVTVQSGGTAAGYFCSNEEIAIVTVNNGYRSVFMSVGIEQMLVGQGRAVMSAALAFLNGTSAPGGTFTDSTCDSSLTADDGTVQDPSESGTTTDTNSLTPETSETRSDMVDPVLLNAAVTDIDSTTVSVAWDTNAQLSSSIAYVRDVSTGELMTQATGDTTTVTFSDLSPSTTYQLIVHGVFANGYVTPSYQTYITTLDAAPATPIVKKKYHNRIKLTLETNNTDRHAVDVMNSAGDILRTETAKVGATTLTISDLTPKTTYTVRSRYVDSEGEATSSDSATLEVTTHPNTISRPTLIDTRADAARFRWDKPIADTVTRYRVQLWKKKGGTYTVVRTIKLDKKLKKDKKTLWVKELKQNTRYKMRVRAIYADGTHSPYSAYRGVRLSAE